MAIQGDKEPLALCPDLLQQQWSSAQQQVLKRPRAEPDHLCKSWNALHRETALQRRA